MRFSQRFGHRPIKNKVQLKSIDDDLRNSLWNALKNHYWNTAQLNFMSRGPFLTDRENEILLRLCTSIWEDYFKKPIDTLTSDWEAVYTRLRNFFFSCEWFEVYDFVEFVATSYPDDRRNQAFRQDVNEYLEREVAGYRFVDGSIAEITNSAEIESVESAAMKNRRPVSLHLERALQMLSDRRNPDYRNSIKESISAVEAQVKISSGEDKGTLGELLKRLSAKKPLHPALQEAFSKLYGYTSDADGIRHALMGEDKSTFEEAKFMLVACSAFINYVRGVLKD